MKTIFSLLIFLASTSVFAGETLISKGKGFDKEGKEQKFTYERYISKEGDKVTHRAVYKDMDGDVMTEETLVEEGGKMVRYDMKQNQLKQDAWIVVKDDKVEYNLKKFRKNNYPITDKLKDNFVVGLQLVDLIRDNWDKIANGKTVDFNLGVWHRQETIGFRFTKESDEGGNLVVKMNPSSMFIRAVVNPLYFHLDKKSKKLVKYVGRTTPKEKRGRDFYDFDGLVTYENMGEAPQAKEAAKAPKPASKKK